MCYATFFAFIIFFPILWIKILLFISRAAADSLSFQAWAVFGFESFNPVELWPSIKAESKRKKHFKAYKSLSSGTIWYSCESFFFTAWKFFLMRVKFYGTKKLKKKNSWRMEQIEKKSYLFSGWKTSWLNQENNAWFTSKMKDELSLWHSKGTKKCLPEKLIPERRFKAELCRAFSLEFLQTFLHQGYKLEETALIVYFYVDV